MEDHDAVRLAIKDVTKITAFDPVEFPYQTKFVYSSEKKVVKVPSPDGKRKVWREKMPDGYYLRLQDQKGKTETLKDCKKRLSTGLVA